MITPSLWLITAHLIGDFPLQPDWIAQTKTENNTRLAIHVSIHSLLNIPIAWILFPESTVQQFVLVAWITLSHLIIDYRRWVDPKEEWGDNAELWVWLNDQILHLISLSFAIPVSSLELWA